MITFAYHPMQIFQSMQSDITIPQDITVGALSQLLKSVLTKEYGNGEASSMTRIIMEESLHLNPVDTVLRRDEAVLPESARRIEGILQRLINGEPIQYIYGHTTWYGGEIEVTPAVLIPRPETAQLVDMIEDQWGHQSDLNVLDIATGSGCIAVTLARTLPFANVDAIDISEDALTVARRNASRQHVKVNFSKGDALHLPHPKSPTYNIIVSNPPYIPEHDRAEMSHNVLEHEPHIALFVPDSDPMLFYRPIAAYASDALVPGGMLYVELDPAGADSVAQCMRDAGLTEVSIYPDFTGRRRFATAQKPQ